MKQFSAIIAALLITGIVGSAMVIVGGNALINKNSVPVLNSFSGSQGTIQAASSSGQDAAQTQAQADAQTLANAQQEINQLQTALGQYQTRLNQAVTQLNQNNTQIAQYQAEIQQVQNLLSQMQNAGLITITSNGQILINNRRDDR